MSTTIYDPTIFQDRANALVDCAFSEIRRNKKVMTDYADMSEVEIFNVHAGEDTIEVLEMESESISIFNIHCSLHL